MACVPDRDGAMREVEKAYELIRSHQPHLQSWDEQQPSAAINLSQSLLNQAMLALRIALSVMSSEFSTHAGAENSSRSSGPHVFFPSSAPSHVEGIASQQRKDKTRRSNEVSSRVILTDAPHEDGYAWRKYGEKKINGTHFTRNYFRCSYKYDRGCQATKQIQQQSGNDMPMFQVTYISEHTCNCTTSANKYSQGDLPQLSYFNTDGRIISLDHAMIKQEQKRLLPPLDELSTVFLDSTSFCQEPVPINMTITDDGTPDFESESRDGFIDLGQMLLPLEPLEDNPFNDSELDVLFNSMLQN